MAIWEVNASKIELLPHPNADRMQIGRVGKFQLVVGKGQYESGDIIVFAPERAILPESLKGEYVNSETGISYLSGSEQNRVKQVRLRGELSEGVTIPISWVLEQVPEWNSVSDIPLDVDLSEKLGISKYQPAIPYNMAGVINSFDSVNFGSRSAHHDVEQFRLFADEFLENEEVICSEKIHGCLSEETIVDTFEFGPMKISEIVQNNMCNIHVKSFDIISQEIIYSQIGGVSEQANINNWYELTTDTGEKLLITGNHLIWLPDLKCYRKVSDLQGSENLLLTY